MMGVAGTKIYRHGRPEGIPGLYKYKSETIYKVPVQQCRAVRSLLDHQEAPARQQSTVWTRPLREVILDSPVLDEATRIKQDSHTLLDDYEVLPDLQTYANLGDFKESIPGHLATINETTEEVKGNISDLEDPYNRIGSVTNGTGSTGDEDDERGLDALDAVSEDPYASICERSNASQTFKKEAIEDTSISDTTKKCVIDNAVTGGSHHTKKPVWKTKGSHKNVVRMHSKGRRRTKSKKVCPIHVIPSDSESCDSICIERHRGKYIEYLVEVFRPLLLSRLQAMELVQHLDFVDNRDIEGIENPKKAVYELLASIHNSTTPKKWESFSQALDLTENTYMKKLVTGETENDSTYKVQVLQLYKPEMAKDIHLEEFLDLLFEEEVISRTDKEYVQARNREKGETHAALLLLDLLPNRNENWNSILIETLRKCGMSGFADSIREASTEPADETVVKEPIKRQRRLNSYTPIPCGGLCSPKQEAPQANDTAFKWPHSTNSVQCDDDPSVPQLPPRRYTTTDVKTVTETDDEGPHLETGDQQDDISSPPPLPCRRSYSDWELNTATDIPRQIMQQSVSQDTIVKRPYHAMTADSDERPPPLPCRKSSINLELNGDSEMPRTITQQSYSQDTNVKRPYHAMATDRDERPPPLPCRKSYINWELNSDQANSPKVILENNDQDPPTKVKRNNSFNEYDDTAVKRLTDPEELNGNETASDTEETRMIQESLEDDRPPSPNEAILNRLQNIDKLISHILQEKDNILASLNIDSRDHTGYQELVFQESHSEKNDRSVERRNTKNQVKKEVLPISTEKQQADTDDATRVGTMETSTDESQNEKSEGESSDTTVDTEVHTGEIFVDKTFEVEKHEHKDIVNLIQNQVQNVHSTSNAEGDHVSGGSVSIDCFNESTVEKRETEVNSFVLKDLCRKVDAISQNLFQRSKSESCHQSTQTIIEPSCQNNSPYGRHSGTSPHNVNMRFNESTYNQMTDSDANGRASRVIDGPSNNADSNASNVFIQELIAKISQLETRMEEMSSKNNYVEVQRVPMDGPPNCSNNPDAPPMFMPQPWYGPPVAMPHPLMYPYYPTPFMPFIHNPEPQIRGE